MRVAAAALCVAGLHAAVASAYSAAYRKDYYLKDYIETEGPEPVDGGRLHIVGLAAATGVPGAVYLNGTFLNMSTGLNPSEWAADWVRVEPIAGLVAGAPFWISLHTRVTSWDAALAAGGSASIVVTAAGTGAVLVNGTFPVVVPPVRITWVTTANNGSDVHLFLHNDNSATGSGSSNGTYTATQVLFNGQDITAAIPAPQRSIPPAQSVVWVLPVSAVGGAAAVAPGSVWTLEVTLSAASSGSSEAAATVVSAAGGMFFREFYPRETWPHGSDCPFPTLNDTAYALHRSHGVDTFFAEYTFDAACNTNLTSVDLINTLAPQYDFWVLPSAESGGVVINHVTDTSRLAGFFLADEDDTVVDDKARQLLASNVQVRSKWPGQPTYAGGASNRYTGAYAGITDIKGLDAYIGACAPHYALFAMPARGSYDYLVNTRNNHAPGATWLYSQGFEDGWDEKTFDINRQANAAEIAIQVLSVVAAGAKGLMLFETQLKYVQGESAPAWATLGTLLREIGALRELYRGGDITGMAAALTAVAGGAPVPDVIVEATLHPRAVVVTAINTAAVNNTYNDICCLIGPCHFTFVPSSIASLQVALPAGFTVVDSFEVFNATVLPGSLSPSPGPAPGSLALANVQMGVTGPGSAPCTDPSQAIVRTFVLAADSSLRNEIAAALAQQP